MIDDCFKIPWLLLRVFGGNEKLWKVRGFFFLAPFASQLCRPFRFCCWLFSISWMRISECLKKYSFGMDISWLCIKCWYLDSFARRISFHLSLWPWPLFLSRSQEAALLGIVCASWVCNLQLGLLKCLNWTRERERRTNTCPLHFNTFLSFYLRLAIWAVAEQALSSPVASLVESAWIGMARWVEPKPLLGLVASVLAALPAAVVILEI